MRRTDVGANPKRMRLNESDFASERDRELERVRMAGMVCVFFSFFSPAIRDSTFGP